MATPVPARVRRLSRRPVLPRRPGAVVAAILAYVGLAFAVEPFAGRAGELLVGMVTWLLLLALLRRAPSAERAQVAAVVLVAMAGEVLGSLVLGLYAYRRGGIPAFVPPGHGLVYLAGIRLAQTRAVGTHPRTVVRVAAAAGAVWALLALGFSARPDVVGALAMIAMIAFLARGRRPPLFACMLLVVAVLELYGTRMGTWHWSPRWPGLDLGMGNPPSGVAAGYCAFDALALRLAPRLERLAVSLRRRRPRAALRATPA